MTITVDQAIAAYMTLRAKKAEVEARIKDEVTQLETKMDKIEAWIKAQADALGVTSFKTKHGTAFLTTKDYANVENWDATLNFIKETEAVLGANFVYDLRGLCYVHVSIPFCHYLDLIKVLQKCQ